MNLFLDHIGLGVQDSRRTAELLIDLGICEMHEDTLDERRSCNLIFSCEGILQLHDGENATGVKLAVRVKDPGDLKRRLTNHGIGWEDRADGQIGFIAAGIEFHTVQEEE